MKEELVTDLIKLAEDGFKSFTHLKSGELDLTAVSEDFTEALKDLGLPIPAGFVVESIKFKVK